MNCTDTPHTTNFPTPVVTFSPTSQPTEVPVTTVFTPAPTAREVDCDLGQVAIGRDIECAVNITV
eukprot:CAMPEP_0197027332 /NCGR_PEP_ID=MMETSP1384-20130603/7267_1 /TAXON_ID=29189 /ORGANISM="Ammonia sp." /LENGTH=64 /DNA_ID=CAMNT_0042456163 /DNA_START=57 /DNA_END=248 /DNA_ORIENTATION=+